HVRGQHIRAVECTYSDEPDDRPCAEVVAPDGDLADRAAGNLLACTTLGRCIDDLRLDAEALDPIGFNHGIQDERRTGFTLTPATVTAVNNQGCRLHTVANGATGAAAFSR